MFNQTFIEAGLSSKKRLTMLLSLLLQIVLLAALITAPLIYTQVLPRVQLRSVFAAPAPPPPSLPKPPTTVRSAANSLRLFRLEAFRPIFPLPRTFAPEVTAPPAISDGTPGGDPSSNGVPLTIAPVGPPDPPLAIKNAPAKPIRIGSMEASQLIHKVQPAYPAMARQLRVQGIVEFTAVIGKTGAIQNLQLVRGHPMLVKAAEEAILQWKYKPTLLNGEPVEVITDILVNFTLTQ